MHRFAERKKRSLFKIFLWIDVAIIILSLMLSSVILYSSNASSARALIDEQNKTQVTWLDENIRNNYAMMENIGFSVQYDNDLRDMFRRNYSGNDYSDFMEKYDDIFYVRQKFNGLVSNLNMHICGIMIYLDSRSPYRIIEEIEDVLYYDDALREQSWYRDFIEGDSPVYYLGGHYIQVESRDQYAVSLIVKLQNISQTEIYGCVFVNVLAEDFYKSVAAVYENSSFRLRISDENGLLYSNASGEIDEYEFSIEPYGLTVSYASGVNFAALAFGQSWPALLVFVCAGMLSLAFSVAMLRKIFRDIQWVFDGIHLSVLQKKDELEPSPYREINYFITSFNFLLREVDEQIRERAHAEAEQKNAKLLSLQYQINPHFLFNMLEVFRMRLEALGDTDAADSVADFGNIMRYNISDDSKMTTLCDEIEISRKFVGLYRFKYKNTLTFSSSVNENVANLQTLKFILQPIVENSIKYGKGSVARQMHIGISAYEKNGFLLIDVEDNGIGFTPEKLQEIRASLNRSSTEQKSIGLKNVYNRLKLFYGAGAELLIESRQNERTVITIKIPI